MRITWRDGITTLATAGAIVLEQAYYREWDWPLISSTRWTIAGLAVLIAISFISSYIFDVVRGTTWSWVAGLIGLTAAALTGLGLNYAISDYVILLMFTAVVFWLASVVRDVSIPSTMMHHHA